MRAIKSNMKDQTGRNCTDKKILHCPTCNGEWSGNAGDYFNYPDDHVFHCEHDGTELELVTKVVTVRYVQ